MLEDGQVGEWLSLTDAARTLGVSERTLRRHIRADRYPVRQDGNRIYLLVAAEAGEATASRPRPKDGAASPAALPDGLADRLDRLEPRLAGVGQRLESLESVRERLDAFGHRIERLEWVAERLLNRTESLRRAVLTLERRTSRVHTALARAEGPAGDTGPPDRPTGGPVSPPPAW